MSEKKATHGATRGGRRTPEYGVWAASEHRCRTPSCTSYERYGGRGVYVCQRWHAFAHFIADMGRRPTNRHSLDRIDGSLNYTCGKCAQCVEGSQPANCRWATGEQQHSNKTNNRRLTFDGLILTASQWARRRGMKEKTVLQRLTRGLSAEEVLHPVTRSGRPAGGVCGRGHPFSGDNLVTHQSGAGKVKRQCRACHKMMAALRAKKTHG